MNKNNFFIDNLFRCHFEKDKNSQEPYMINENQRCKTVYFTKIIETIFIYCALFIGTSTLLESVDSINRIYISGIRYILFSMILTILTWKNLCFTEKIH